MLKYYFLRIKIQFGEFSEVTYTVFKDDTNNPRKVANKITMESRSCSESDWDSNHEGWWFMGNLVQMLEFEEITKEEYDTLKKFIS
jgi:hypothetical protein